jgi:hypothetical protein
MDLEGARALAYEGSAWEMVAAAAECGDEGEGLMAREYLLDHASRLDDALALAEAVAPWGEMEAWVRMWRRYPIGFLFQKESEKNRDLLSAWMHILADIKSDKKIRDWRFLICVIMLSSNLYELCRYLSLFMNVETELIGRGDNLRVRAFGAMDFGVSFYAVYDKFSITSISKGRHYGPMGYTENDGFIKNIDSFVLIARQLGIEPPARVIAGLGG